MMLLFVVFCVLFLRCCSADTYVWKQLPQATGVPSPRFDYAYGYNNATQLFYVFGGQTETNVVNDFYSYHIATNSWQAIDVGSDGPTPRHNAAGTVFNNSFYMIGGRPAGNTSSFFDEMWVYTQGWKLIDHYPNLQLSGGSLSVVDNYLFYFGGKFQNGTYSQLTYVFDFDSLEWTISKCTNTPIGREYSPLAHIDAPFDTTAMFGGYYGGIYPQNNELWLLNDTTGNWMKWQNNQADWPCNRSGHILVHYTGSDSLVLYAGESDSADGLADMWIFSLISFEWEQADLPTPGKRIGSGFVQTEYGLFVFGGVTGWSKVDYWLNDMWLLTYFP